MMNVNPLKQLVTKQKNKQAVGIYSACSANRFVIEAVIKRGKEDNSCVLIESTANQCDQFGGYTGMKPIDFKNFVLKIAEAYNFDTNKLFLGGDHLGPLTWTHLNEEEAMKHAEVLIGCYVKAGFTKIHIDTSMKVADDDPHSRLSDEIIAKRGARLAKVAELAYQELLIEDANAIRPVYIVGSEVPIPGGAQEAEEGIQVTCVDDFEKTVEAFQVAFDREGIHQVWDDVIAVVVQPGVEFGDSEVHEYSRETAKALTDTVKSYPNVILEGHSTDYQTKVALRQLVEDGIGILKVGPGLTFALREAIFALNNIEKELFKNTNVRVSQFIEVLEEQMLVNPKNWEKHYHGDENKKYLARKYSFSDRARYYIQDAKVEAELSILLKNLNNYKIPYTLLSQFMPIQYIKVREGKLENSPEALIRDRIINCIDEYLYATNQNMLF